MHTYKVIGLKIAKREPWISDKGKTIDDGINKEIILCESHDKRIADYFFNSIKSRIHGKSWKIRKEG